MPAHVQGHGRALGDDFCGHIGHGGDVQRGSKIIGAAGGQIAQQRLVRQLHQPRDGLVQRAVAAVAGHGVKQWPYIPGKPGCVAGGRSLPHVHQVSSCGQAGDSFIQRSQGFVLPCSGIHDQKKLFHS